MFLYQTYRKVPVNWSYDCYALEFYRHITFNSFALEIIQSFSDFLESINFLSDWMAFYYFSPLFFSFEALIEDFFLNCLEHTMGFHFRPFKVMFLKKCIFHKYFVNSPKELSYLHPIKATVLSNVLSHQKTFMRLQLYFNTMNSIPWVWFFFTHLIY